MTNEELVALIQSGERDKLPELWEQVERFVALQANKRHLLFNGLGGVEVEDLYQSGYIALVCAADTYDPAALSLAGWPWPLKPPLQRLEGIEARDRPVTRFTALVAWTRPWETMRTVERWGIS